MDHQHLWNLKLVAVHVNHQLRGQEADLDQEWVEQICREWGIECISKKVDVAKYAKEHHLSKQVAARECRYQLFSQVAKENQATKLALAHHGDDQIETMVMRLVRGAGLAGLSGIPTKRKGDSYMIVRPFMSVGKREIETYCREHRISYREDSSNLRDDYTRNWIRHHISPLLFQLNPNLHQVIHETTSLIREEDELLEEMAQNYVKQVIESESMNKITMNLSLIKTLPLPLQRRVILLILSYLQIERSSWSKVHIDQILEIIQNEKGSKTLDMPDQVQVVKEYHQLYIMKVSSESQQDQSTLDYLHSISHLGEYHFSTPPIQMILYQGIDRKKEEEWESLFSRVWKTHFLEGSLQFPLVLRNRRSGDRIQPIGMEGHKKVKDIFIDEKVPVRKRQDWPILTDQAGIIWVPGLKRSNRGKVTETRQNIITIMIGTD